MGMVSLGGAVCLPDDIFPSAGITSARIDATLEKVAAIFSAPQTGNVTKVEIATRTVTGTTKSIRVGLQALDAAGDPSGTWLGATAAGYGDVATPASTTIYQVTLGENAPVVANTQYALVIAWTNDADSGDINFNLGLVSFTEAQHTAYLDYYLTGAWVKTALGGHINISLVYGTTRYNIPSCPPCQIIASVPFETDATLNEVGNVFSLPFGCRIIGARLRAEKDDVITVTLYNSTGTALASGASDKENTQNATSGLENILFVSGGVAAPYTGTAGATYRICMAGSGTATFNAISYTFYEAGALDGLVFGQNYYATHRATAGAFTNTTNMRYSISLLIDQISFPDAGNVQNDDTNTSVTGTLTLPTEAQVESGVTFGAGGTEFEGTLTGGSGGLRTHPGLSGGMRG